MVIGQIVRQTGAYLVPKLFKAFHKYDVRIHRGLYGQAGGRGVRHGRDLGAAIGGSLSLGQGDDLDSSTQRPPFTPGKKPKTYRGRADGRNKYNRNYCPPGGNRGSFKPRKYYGSRRRVNY